MKTAPNDVWLTPPDLIDDLGGAESFDFDPCAAEGQPWPTAKVAWTIRDNGLYQPWLPGARAWVNPPYSGILPWILRMSDHACGTALIFSKTGTEAFMSIMDTADAVFFLQGRLRFHLPCGSPARDRAQHPSVLCAWGADDADRLASLQRPGRFLPLRVPRHFAVMALTPSWREAVRSYIASNPGPVALADLYRAFARHPKSVRNRHYKAKVRQTLARGGFQRIGKDLWVLAA